MAAVWLAAGIRDLVLATWETDRRELERALPPGLGPASLDGSYLVSLVALRAEPAPLGRIPLPAFSLLKVATFVDRGELAVFFLAARASPLGTASTLLGLPYRAARVRVTPGALEAPGVGVSLRYRRSGPARAAPLERSRLGMVAVDGTVREFRVRMGEIHWEAAALVAEPRVDLLLALGFPADPPGSLLYAERFPLEAELPARRVRSSERRSAR